MIGHVPQMVMIALVFWGSGHPAGAMPAACGTYPTVEWRDRIIVAPQNTTPTDDGQTLTTPVATPATGGWPIGSSIGGVSMIPSCGITLSRSEWRGHTLGYRCSLVVHEIGHVMLPGNDPYHDDPRMKRLNNPWCRHWAADVTRSRQGRHRWRAYADQAVRR